MDTESLIDKVFSVCADEEAEVAVAAGILFRIKLFIMRGIPVCAGFSYAFIDHAKVSTQDVRSSQFCHCYYIPLSCITDQSVSVSRVP